MANLLSDTINYISPFCRYMNPAIGASSMPILGIANLVRNIILAAPMIWPWNRNTTDVITTAVGTQDYSTTLSDFSFLEKASLLDPDETKIYQIPSVMNNDALAKATVTARPNAIAVQSWGTAAQTFRFSAVPNKIYPVNLVYQMLPVNFASTSSPWAPIPDSMSDVYNNLVMGYYMDSCQDGRAAQYIGRGIAGLLARQSGLSQMDKAIFAAGYMNLASAEMIQQLKTQQSVQAQGAR
jgi:hypothetical protein